METPKTLLEAIKFFSDKRELPPVYDLDAVG